MLEFFNEFFQLAVLKIDFLMKNLLNCICKILSWTFLKIKLIDFIKMNTLNFRNKIWIWAHMSFLKQENPLW